MGHAKSTSIVSALPPIANHDKTDANELVALNGNDSRLKKNEKADTDELLCEETQGDEHLADRV